MKQKKFTEVVRQTTDLHKEIGDIRRDCEELSECKVVLATEINEEQAYQDQMRNLIAKIKRNIYEVKTNREKIVKEIN